MENAIIVFTKVPKTGYIKTRLTTDRDGIFTDNEAREFYEACLLDVINTCIASDSGDVWICYDAQGDRDYLEKLLSQDACFKNIKGIFPDHVGSFDDCMQYAADYILKSGNEDRVADSVLIVGGDIPTLQPAILKQAVGKMTKLAQSRQGQAIARQSKPNPSVGAAMVEAGCQEGGFSVVGYTCTTPFDFSSVFYNQDGITASSMLIAKAKNSNIPFACLEMVPDVDIPVDLASIIPMLEAIQVASQYDTSIFVPVRTINILADLGIVASALPPQR